MDSKKTVRERVVAYFANSVQNLWKGLFEDDVVSEDEEAEAREVKQEISEAIRRVDTGPNPARMEEVLNELIKDIENTDGVLRLANGLHVPLADEDWVDLGETYMNACDVLGKTPVVVEDD